MESTRDWLDDLKLRVGYGQTGNSEVPRITNYAMELATYPKRSDYDLNGQNNSTTTGFILDKYGNEGYQVGVYRDVERRSGRYFLKW